MTLIAGYDPLALLAIQSGQIGPPRNEAGAAGASVLDVDQRSVSIGEPVPIVFCRRRDDKGGVLISPGATEARFENDTSNNVTAYYHLVLSEGRIGDVAVKDVFQRSCRVGTFTQTYNRRAGTWTPGNFVVPRAGFDEPDASYYCGSIGIYPDISTFSFQVTIPDGFDQWKRQVHLFIRNGIQVTRLIDNVLGSSDNFADLVRWMLLNGRRVPTQLVDVPQLQKAAIFLETNGFTCNTWIQQSRNYSDLLATWAPYFLLGESNDGGKKGLRPLLPTNNDGTLKTDAIDWEYIFTDNEILPGTFELEYTSFAQRLPFVAQMTWRQQLENDIGIIRTAEVRYINTAEVGPYESHDMSEYCTSENHAVKIGAYILARRRFVTHTIRFAARPQSHNRLLVPGDICRVRLAREIIGESPSEHDYLYQVERVTKTLAGQVGYECSHFPIDNQGRSIIALNVANATGTGILLTSNSTGVGCDINSATDNTIPVESFIVPGSEFDIGGFDTGTIVATGAGAGIGIDDLGIPDGSNLGVGDLGSGFGGGSGSTGGGIGGGGGDGPSGSAENPSDGVDATALGAFENPPIPGGLAVQPPSGICEGAVITRIIGNIGDEGNAISETVEEYSIPIVPPEELGGDDWNNKFIEFRVTCPNGEEQVIDPVVIPNVITLTGPARSLEYAFVTDIGTATRCDSGGNYCDAVSCNTSTVNEGIITVDFDFISFEIVGSSVWDESCACGVPLPPNRTTNIVFTSATGQTFTRSFTFRDGPRTCSLFTSLNSYARPGTRFLSIGAAKNSAGETVPRA
jgi:hypothetical protein